MISKRPYTLRKSHQALVHGNTYYKRFRHRLSPDKIARLESLLSELDTAVVAGDRLKADLLARELETFGQTNFTRPIYHYAVEIVVALAVALAIAVVIRQAWFEPYQIPTGSMRPTFREQDHLVVTKTAFGLNVPLRTEHFYFDPSLMRRAGVVVFSADGLDMADVETTYFWVFPSIKRLIKRCLALPGDTFYFYGGKIYGIDKDGRDITPEMNPTWLDRIDHIPFLNFEGRIAVETLDDGRRVRQIFLKQLNIPFGRLTVSGNNIEGAVFNGKEWVKDNPTAAMGPHDTVETYGDLLGIGNFAVARLLTHDEVDSFSEVKASSVGDGTLYLELHHNPSLTYPEPRFQRAINGELRLFMPTQVSVIPLQEKQMKALWDQLYTVRFVVRDGRATAYLAEGMRFDRYSPAFPGVPDGTYEFYYGKAYSVAWAGVTTLLPPDHALNRFSPENLQKLFNLGIEMNTAFMPSSKEQLDLPSRFAYFRDGALYVMGAPVFQPDDPLLVAFNENELKRQTAAQKNKPYLAFKDRGAPYKDGQIDQTFLKTFGITVPDKHYLMLGDNYARSGDSRAFGFVPEANVQGAPLWIFWPPGSRWGPPLQAHYQFVTLPTVIVWSIAAVILLAWWLFTRWRMRRHVFVKLP